MADPVIRAAGVVLLRDTSRGPRVLIVHRPRHKDWSLPKGKLDKGEHVVAAAVRECREETGFEPVLGPYLDRLSYPVMGRPKTVDYWVARVRKDHGFRPNDEVDKISWVSPTQARRMLSYQRDADLLRQALTIPATSPLVILRHTTALKRSDFSGRNDARRPLAARGKVQAKELVDVLGAYAIDRIHSSDATRCVQTVQPFASARRVRIHSEPLFSEEGFADRPKAAVRRITDLADSSHRLCVCSHRPVLPALVRPFATDKKAAAATKEPLAPGSMVVVHRTISKSGWSVAATDRIDL